MRMGGSASGTEDALADGVLIADRLDGRPLDGDHGAPARLVSPNQYGFVSTKHLCRIELHSAGPSENYHPSAIVDVGLRLLKPHARARVWGGGASSLSPRLVSAALLPPPHRAHCVPRRSRQPARSDPTRAPWLANVN